MFAACSNAAVEKPWQWSLFAEIVLAYVVEVPFTFSLNTPVPAEEARGDEALRTARFIVEHHGLPVETRIVHHRSAWAGILELARQERADAIVMSANRGRARQGDAMGRTAEEVVKRATCDVVLVQMADRHNNHGPQASATVSLGGGP